MKKLVFFPLLLAMAFAASAQEYEWKAVELDGSLTGVVSPSKGQCS